MRLQDHTPAYISSRFDRVFRARPVLARFGLQYRLCEVGPKRLDHYQLNHEIAERLNTGEINEPLPGLFLSGRDKMDNIALQLARAGKAYEIWRGLSRVRALDDLMDTVIDCVTGAGRTISELGATPKIHGGSLHPSRYVDLNSAREAATLWVTWNEDAISPADKDLWRFLEHCAARNRVPLILARAIAKATFPILSSVGARGIQYFCVLSSSAESVDLAQLQDGGELLGLPHVRDARTMRDHPAINVLLAQLSSIGASRFPSVSVDAALSVALRRGFATKGATPRTLRRWAVDVEQECGIAMPERWKSSLKRWMRTESQSTIHETAVQERAPAKAPIASRDHEAPTVPASNSDKPSLDPHRIRVAAEVDAETFSRVERKMKRRGG